MAAGWLEITRARLTFSRTPARRTLVAGRSVCLGVLCVATKAGIGAHLDNADYLNHPETIRAIRIRVYICT